MARGQAKDIYRARHTFFATVGDKSRKIKRGDLIEGGDPVLKGREGMFQTVSEYVEQATAAPGEKRSVPTRPQKEEHECEACGETFGSPAALGSHKRVHADDE